MPSELSRFESHDPARPEEGPGEVMHAGAERERTQEHLINELLGKVSDVYYSVLQLEREEPFPRGTQDVIQNLCLAQQTLLEERLHALRPELHPGNAMNGEPYSHRNEVVARLQRAISIVSKRDIRTVDTTGEAE